MRAEREAVGRQLVQERRRAEAAALKAAAAAAAREEAARVEAALEQQLAQQGEQLGATRAEEAELRLQAEQAPQGELAALQRLVERSTSLKLQQVDFKKQCKAQLQQLQQQREAQLEEEAEEGAEGGEGADTQLAKVRRVERLFEAESAKADQMRRLLGQKGRQIASLQRQMDEIPTRAELMQYERRFRELYQQLASKSEETKRYYDQYNILGEKQGYLTKEASLINSIHDNFLKVSGSLPLGRAAAHAALTPPPMLTRRLCRLCLLCLLGGRQRLKGQARRVGGWNREDLADPTSLYLLHLLC